MKNIYEIIGRASLLAILGFIIVKLGFTFWREYYSAKTAAGVIINKQGEEIGNIEIQQGPKGVLLSIDAFDLPPGKHGMHFHMKGDCSDFAEGFKKSGMHIGGKKPNGLLDSKGPQRGNLANLFVYEDGSTQFETFSTFLNLDYGMHQLLDKDGSALIIHENADSHYKEQNGGSGPRIACAVIGDLNSVDVMPEAIESLKKLYGDDLGQ